MEVLAPSPQTTLLILLGASAWPLSPEFQASEAFANAARRARAYFLNPQPFGLPDENLLDLFDADDSADELDVAIGQFIEQRLAAMKTAGKVGRDLLLYFIGHGGFVGYDSDFYLAIRRTRMDSPRASGIQMMSLADTLTGRARHLRRILILDCCFAAAAFSAFQAGPDQVALQKTKDAFEVRRKTVGFPTKGTTLLCSSNHKSPSLIMPDGGSTMFTKAFLDALVHGSPLQQDQLTLRDVKDRVTDLLSEIRNAPKPVVHSPDQSEGDVADIPFFPNPRIEEERLPIPVETPAPPLSLQEGPAAQIPHQPSKVSPPPGAPSAPESSSVVVGKRSLRRLIPHPWLLSMCLLSLLLLFGASVLAPFNYTLVVVLGIACYLIFFVSCISSAVIAARGRHWVWLVLLILTLGFATPFFSIFARPKNGALPSTAGTDTSPPQQPHPGSLQHSSSAQARGNNQQGPQHPWGATLKGSQQSLGLGSSPVNIGRSPHNQLILNDPQASKVHAHIYAQGQNHLVVDMASANGTFVNEQKLLPNTPHLLNVGDRVRIGHTVFTYTSRDSVENDDRDVHTNNTVIL